MAANARALTELSADQAAMATARLREIFFLTSSRQTFADDEEREAFFQKWTSFYFQRAPEQVFFALGADDQKVLGYLTGYHDSLAAQSALSATNKAYDVFADLFERFPAHLHINLHPLAQGQGLGRLLIEQYVTWLQERRVKGLHLVTSPAADNVLFYRKCGFAFELEKDFKGTPLLFMGRSI